MDQAPGKQNSFRVNALGHVRPKKYRRLFDSDVSDTDRSRFASTENEPSSVDNAEKGDAPVDVDASLRSFDCAEEVFDHHDAHVQGTKDPCPVLSSVADGLRSFLSDHDLDPIEHEEAEISHESDKEDEDPFEDEDHMIPENENVEDAPELDEDKLISPGHFLTVKVCVLLLWLYAINHSITGTQLSDLLTIISLLCVDTNPALTSLYRFKRYFVGIKSPLQKHFFCGFCYTPVEEMSLKCTNNFCLKDISQSKHKKYFIYVPISSQLQEFYRRDDFTNAISQRFSRPKMRQQNIEDICDGSLYKALSEGDGPLSSKFPYNISFTMNTDGVPVFKSSGVSIWPVYLMINELPFKMRKQQSNMLMCGLWFGNTKPFMASFMEPLHRELEHLERGIQLEISGNQELCKSFLLCLTADLPARSSVLNTVQFNGEYSCIKCESKGENFRTEKGGNIRVFPYCQEQPSARTKESCLADALEAHRSKSTVHGMKGLTFLMALNYFDIVKCVSIDYMHCVLQGITKLLIKLWFGTSGSGKAFSLHGLVDVIDARMKNIQPTNTISRMPRSIKEHFKYWKASELRAWLFYYSLPVLTGIMSPTYLYHYAAFVEAIYLLSSESISFEDIEKAQQLLCYFVYMLETLYGKRYLTLNAHSLLHLPQTVKEIGPLWAHSCFPCENANGVLLKLFHGTQHVDLQIVNAVNVLQLLPSLSNMVPADHKAYKFVNKMLNRCPSFQKEIGQFYKFLGKGHQTVLKEDLKGEVFRLTGQLHVNCKVYARVVIHHQVYHSIAYTRVSVRNSYTIKYRDNRGMIQHGLVESYGELNDSLMPLCFVKKLDTASSTCSMMKMIVQGTDDSNVSRNFMGIELNHIHILHARSTPVEVIPLSNVISLCVCVEAAEMMFICDEPNLKECNL